jgi:hypothetical protein
MHFGWVVHAQTLTSRLQKILLAAMATPVVGCGGTPDVPIDGGGSIDTGIPNCEAQFIDAGTVCGSTEAQITSDIGACSLSSDSGDVPTATCQAICGAKETICSFDPTANILRCGGLCIGRLTAGQVVADPARAESTGAYLARVAFLETSAVHAFERLGRELRAHGAPSPLTRAVERAREDEKRHATEMAALARAYDADVTMPETQAREVRPLIEVAIENAVEGCVRETFGVLVAAWQAEHAQNERVRTTMKRVARDEARHAALGWRVRAWANDMLSATDRDRVSAAMKAAVDELERSADARVDPKAAEALGLPSAARATALVAALRAEVWP